MGHWEILKESFAGLKHIKAQMRPTFHISLQSCGVISYPKAIWYTKVQPYHTFWFWKTVLQLILKNNCKQVCSKHTLSYGLTVFLIIIESVVESILNFMPSVNESIDT